MSNKNKAAWEQLKREGLTVNARTIGRTAYAGIEKKNGVFLAGGFISQDFPGEQDAKRNARAVARAISRETGIPLHPSVPYGGEKQVPSYTLGRSKLRVMWEMEQREKAAAMDDEIDGSFMGRVVFVFVGVLVSLLLFGFFLGAAWLVSLI